MFNWFRFTESKFLFLFFFFFQGVFLFFFFSGCFFLFFFFKFLNLILFFNFTILYWFCHISTWIRHRYFFSYNLNTFHEEKESGLKLFSFVVLMAYSASISLYHHVHIKTNLTSGSRWQSRRTCTHLLLQEHQNRN